MNKKLNCGRYFCTGIYNVLELAWTLIALAGLVLELALTLIALAGWFWN